jgi:glutaredoxin
MSKATMFEKYPDVVEVDQSGKARAELREVQKQLKRITAML